MLPVFPPFDFNDAVVLQSRLREALPFRHRIVYDKVTQTSQDENKTAYLVGGIVRDLFLGRQNFDLDFVCTDHAHYLARMLSAVFKATLQIESVKLTTHDKFGTARLDLVFSDASIQKQVENNPESDATEIHLDLATARTEIYAYPAALPQVHFPASLDEDLYRRDFTINALALIPVSKGLKLTDPFNGLDDLKMGYLRVLHSRSFVDDPTRILRGIRFAARFGYTFEPETELLLRSALAGGYLQKLSAERVRNEILLILRENRPEIAFQLLKDYNILPVINPLLEWNDTSTQLFRELRSNLGSKISSAAYFAGLTYLLQPNQVQKIVSELRFFDSNEKIPVQVSQLWNVIQKDLLNPYILNSQLYSLLHSFDDYALEVGSALFEIHNLPEIATKINFYLEELKSKKPKLGGDFLLELGLKRGPLFGQLLSELQNAVLDGLVSSRSEEEAFILEKISHPTSDHH